jgi:hypothetical protein
MWLGFKQIWQKTLETDLGKNFGGWFGVWYGLKGDREDPNLGVYWGEGGVGRRGCELLGGKAGRLELGQENLKVSGLGL